MPELPEVETTLRGIAPHVTGRRVTAVTARAAKLRLPIPPELGERLTGKVIEGVERRAKYLLLRCGDGTAIIHLGMTGTLRVAPAGSPPGKYDHLDLVLDDGRTLRFRDPRKFGLVLWTGSDPLAHPLLAQLGPEPFPPLFNGSYLFARSRKRNTAIKLLLMDNRIVVGVGNIYANEALFRARIHPERAAGSLSEEDCATLATAVEDVLRDAIAEGNATLHEFIAAEVPSGYFRIDLAVYGRTGKVCTACGTPIARTRLGNRSTWFCPLCQK
ncbi:bifunctional DNA-formamidopyrimidine glycosylase/DNA-(apurinic or apyrimidinic site) lyase [Geobacter anodireducens]|uniref:Formamidopyrimidine-DNA glycosylase n=1 Tax=Geobacter anodireducens TaxID=1340425 RepID=A0ABR9NRZ9_9BACT|nr:bifunctional DNA-formamidopyrimidine glycosylase/DNA-(apurinic or apyrimidinic site) lyase [Geobacter anodireducens]MBE2887046.1 bifunctional DNA-formamidopyrimidine glycosylase/DNA-(apurinic or apyrimidinic site) lyase [Geobacter anodireducens]HMN03708.1 bifunctional DNA-formamidopyrimidine glycosylase/DNA-(apurinic or apyrimidinic site) lyase [Geobacter anodireducens]